MIKNLLNEISETNVSIPGDSNSYFAPISPAANTGGSHVGGSIPPASKSYNLMEMLQRGKQKMSHSADKTLPQIKSIGVCYVTFRVFFSLLGW